MLGYLPKDMQEATNVALAVQYEIRVKSQAPARGRNLWNIIFSPFNQSVMLTIDFTKMALELIAWLHFMDAGANFEIKEELDEPPFGDGTSMVKNIYKDGQQVYGGAELVLELLPIYIEARENAEDDNPDVEGYQDSMRDTNE